MKSSCVRHLNLMTLAQRPIFYFVVEMVGATVRRASPRVLFPRLLIRSPSDHSLFAGSPDLLTYGCAHIGFDSHHPHR